MNVKIYKPARTAMQSGVAKNQFWILEYEAQGIDFKDPLLGWTGSTDTQKQTILKFPTKEAAIAYAEHKGLKYKVLPQKQSKVKKKSYSDNFK